MNSTNFPVIVMLASIGLLIYTYAGYPALLWLLSKFTQSKGNPIKTEPTQWPTVSVILSAFNEEQIIAERVKNLLALDYPPECLEILIGSDGSTDRTCKIVERYQTRGVHLVAFKERRGKANVVNDLVAQARGEIVVLTDANTFFHPKAVQELIKGFVRHPSACTVVGCLTLDSSVEGGNLDGVYWRYETFIKKLESRFGTVLGANGAIYAFRREQYHPLPKEAIVDDFLIPMLMRLNSGGGVYFVPEAKAWEKSPDEVRDEFRRRVRIGAGDLQALLWTWKLLLPWKGLVSIGYFSHKVLRWFGPWLMVIVFLANLWLLDIPFFQVLFVFQLMLYGLGLSLGVIRLLAKVAVGFHFFLVLNAALLLGFVRFILGMTRPFWNTAPRRPALPESEDRGIVRR